MGQINLVYIGTVLIIILLSMTFHEAMHAFVSYWLGDDTAKHQGRLTLNPIKHIDPFLTILLPIILALVPGAPIFGGAKPVPFNPTRVRYGEWGAALIALAGPLTNFLIAFIAFGIWAVTGHSNADVLGGVLQLITVINLGFFVFNMIPLPPLDGSRVLYALAPEFVRRGMEVIERYGIILVFAIVLVASPIIGSFMASSITFFLNLFRLIFAV